jgi:hypothetical protein
MSDRFEESIPNFWKKLGTKVFEIGAAFALTAYALVQADVGGLHSELSDLRRYQQQLVPRDEGRQREQQLRHKDRALRQTIDGTMKEWRDQTLRLQQHIEELSEERDRSLTSIEKDIGDLRVRLSVLENRPPAGAAPKEKPRP